MARPRPPTANISLGSSILKSFSCKQFYQSEAVSVGVSLTDQEPLYGLHSDGEAESQEEDGVDEGPHHLGPGPAVGVLAPLLGADPDADEGHHQSDHVTQHVETVGYQGHRVGDVSHHQLYLVGHTVRADESNYLIICLGNILNIQLW